MTQNEALGLGLILAFCCLASLLFMPAAIMLFLPTYGLCVAVVNECVVMKKPGSHL